MLGVSLQGKFEGMKSFLLAVVTYIPLDVETFKREGVQKPAVLEEQRGSVPPRVGHLDVVGRLNPSMNGNQESSAPRSLVSQAGPSHWDVCSC
jgi:hypothetical protein